MREMPYGGTNCFCLWSFVIRDMIQGCVKKKRETYENQFMITMQIELIPDMNLLSFDTNMIKACIWFKNKKMYHLNSLCSVKMLIKELDTYSHEWHYL